MKKILLFLSNGFEALEAAAFTDVFGWNKTIGSKNTELITASLHEKISCTWGFDVLPMKLLNNVDPCDYEALVIPGGFGRSGFFQDIKNDSFKNMVKEFYIQEKYMVGVCTGALALAESGILKDKKATTYMLHNRFYFNQLENHGVCPVFEEMVTDGKIITSSSPATSLKTAFYLLEKLTTRENSLYIMEQMGFPETKSEIEKSLVKN